MLAVPMLVWKASADEITNVVEEIKTNSFSVDMDNMTKGPQEKERYILSENIENREADSKIMLFITAVCCRWLNSTGKLLLSEDRHFIIVCRFPR